MKQKKFLRVLLVAASVSFVTATVNAQTKASTTQVLQLNVNPSMSVFFGNDFVIKSLDGVPVHYADAASNRKEGYLLETGTLYVRSNTLYHMYATANQNAITGTNNPNNTIDMSGVQMYCHFGGPISQWSWAPYSTTKSAFLYDGSSEWTPRGDNNYNFGWLFEKNTISNTNSDNYTMGVTIEVDAL